MLICRRENKYFPDSKKNSMEIQVNKLAENADRSVAYAIRKAVFIEEQAVDAELEYEFEDESIHFLATQNQQPVGTARWRKTEKGIKLERFAVLKSHRNLGVGSALLKAILADVPPNAKLYLHAQLQAVPFYQKAGFKTDGAPFEEAGITHFLMLR